jgi:hypothetical protein
MRISFSYHAALSPPDDKLLEVGDGAVSLNRANSHGPSNAVIADFLNSGF